MVGKKISDVAYPKSIKTGKELKNGILILNVNHGDQLFIEYSKNDIIDKINSFFGYKFIKEIKLVLIKNKIKSSGKFDKDNTKSIKFKNLFERVEKSKLKKNLISLIDAFNKKNN